MNESKFVKLSATVFMIVLTAQPIMGQVLTLAKIHPI